MKEFGVVFEGRVREIYFVDAESEEEALEKWSDFDPITSEVIDGEITDVEEIM